MADRPYLLATATYRQLRDLPVEVAVLPWGATEAHNLHLPCGTDIVETEAIAAEAARRAAAAGGSILVLPTVPFGVNTGQLNLPGTVNMNPSTQFALLRDVASSLVRQKVPKLVILNGHGGNDFRAMVRELAPAQAPFLCVLDWYRCLDPSDYFTEPGDHAGEMETSLMMHIAPRLVRPLAEAGDGKERRLRIRAFRERWAWTPRDWPSATDDTGVGNPHAATPEKGQRFFEAVTEKIAGFLLDIARADLRDLYE
jgi:creatinine amidohydrolase